MDSLDFNLDEMDVIQQSKPCHDFPAVSFSKYRTNYIAYFNRHAGNLFDKCPCVKIYANAEYVVFQPVTKKDYHSFKISYIKTGCGNITCAGLERLRLDGKTYRLHKTEKGLALKINDPIKTRKV